MEHPETDSIVIDERGVICSEAGTERGEMDSERELSSDDDVEFEDIDLTVIFELTDVVEASELFLDIGGC